MKRASLLLLLALGGCYPVTVAWKSKYFGEPRADTKVDKEWLREVQIKHPDGRLVRLGYAEKTWYYPPGADIDTKYMVYFLYNDGKELIGRYETTGELYRYVREYGEYKETFAGHHTFDNALRLMYGYGAKANVYIGDLDPYRGG